MWTWILLIALSPLILLLTMPFHYRASGHLTSKQIDGRLQLTWAWLILKLTASPQSGVRLHLLGLPIHRFRPSKAKKKPKPKPARKPKASAMWRNRHAYLRLAGRMLRALHPTGWLAGRLGLDNPAETAWLDLSLNPLRATSPAFEVDLLCDYAGPALDLAGGLRGWLWPPQLIGLFLAAALDPRTRRALRPGRQTG